MSVSPRERIVDSALEFAERRSWEAVRLHEVAAALGITLDDIRLHFREKEEIVDAWFDRADKAMLDEAARPEFAVLVPRARLQRLLMRWLGALAAHRAVARQMILNKLEPGHLHYQIRGLLRVSRTVQWWREAAQCNAVLPRRAFEEAAFTAIYLSVFACWLADDTPGAQRTAAFADRLLAGVERLERGVATCAWRV